MGLEGLEALGGVEDRGVYAWLFGVEEKIGGRGIGV